MSDDELFLLAIIAISAGLSGAILGYGFSSGGRTAQQAILCATAVTDALFVAVVVTLAVSGVWKVPRPGLWPALLAGVVYGTGAAVLATRPAVLGSWIGYRKGRAEYVRQVGETQRK